MKSLSKINNYKITHIICSGNDEMTIIFYLYTNKRTMDITALKSSLHHFIEQINSMHLLEDYYHEMKNIVKMTDQNAWDSLTDAQKKEVLMSWQESEDENNLVDHKAVMARYKECFY